MATPFKIAPLIPPKAPNLPIAPVDYAQLYQDQVLNALRLYFNQLDNMAQGLLTGPAGGSYLKFPYVGASDSTDQYADADDTPTIVTWDTLDYGNGFTLASNEVTAQYTGIYKIDYSLQFINTDNAQHDATVWLQVNGTDVAGSASKFSLQQRKSGTIFTYLVGYSSVVFQLNAGDSVALWWATTKAYDPVGPVEGIYIAYEPTQTVPYDHPTVPSAIGAITFLSALP